MSDVTFTTIYVNDLERCTGFYRDVLGMPVKGKGPGWTQFRSHGVPIVLVTKPNGTGVNSPGSDGGTSVRISLRVDDVEEAFRELESRAQQASPPADTPFGRQATLRDPEGNSIDLIEINTSAAQEIITDRTLVNDILVNSPQAMEVLEEHGIRICSGCIILLNGSVRETAEFSGLSPAEASELVEELNDRLAAERA